MAQGVKKRIPVLFGVESFSGGVLRHVVDLALALDPEEFEVHLITSSLRTDQEASDSIKLLEQHGIRVVLLPIRHGAAFPGDCMQIVRIARYIRCHRIAIVHAHSTKAGLLFRLAAWWSGTRTIYTPHCYYFHARAGMCRRIILSAERFLARKTDAVILAENERCAALDASAVNVARIRVINNAMATFRYQIYSREETQRAWELPQQNYIIGGVGRLCRQKQWRVLIEAAAEVFRHRDDVTFLIAGEGEERASLERAIRKRHLEGKVRLLGHVSDVSKTYSCLDVFVSTSLWEGLPYAYLEADCFGLPMILPRLPYLYRLFQGESYRYFPPGDSYAFANQLLLQLEAMSVNGKKPEKIAKMSQPDKEAFDRFVSAHRQLYLELAERI